MGCLRYVVASVADLRSTAPDAFIPPRGPALSLSLDVDSPPQSAWIAWVVIMNSTVHTIMYTYFLASTFGYRSPLAPYLTSLQLLQFLTGITMTCGVHWMGDACDSAASRATLAGIQIYAVGLIILFGSFYKKKYKKE